jgi:hypothetical protein
MACPTRHISAPEQKQTCCPDQIQCLGNGLAAFDDRKRRRA